MGLMRFLVQLAMLFLLVAALVLPGGMLILIPLSPRLRAQARRIRAALAMRFPGHRIA